MELIEQNQFLLAQQKLADAFFDSADYAASRWVHHFGNSGIWYKCCGGCYGDLYAYFDRNPKTVESSELAIKLPYPEKHWPWFDFVVNRSWFKDAFITKTLEEASTVGFKVNLNQTYTKVLAGCIFLRFILNNYSSIFEEYLLMLKEGLSEKEAALLCGMFYKNYESDYPNSSDRRYKYIPAGGGNSDHNVFTSFTNIGHVLNKDSLLDNNLGKTIVESIKNDYEIRNCGIWSNIPHTHKYNPVVSEMNEYIKKNSDLRGYTDMFSGRTYKLVGLKKDLKHIEYLIEMWKKEYH